MVQTFTNLWLKEKLLSVFNYQLLQTLWPNVIKLYSRNLLVCNRLQCLLLAGFSNLG
jgi:hypothetical protein